MTLRPPPAGALDWGVTWPDTDYLHVRLSNGSVESVEYVEDPRDVWTPPADVGDSRVFAVVVERQLDRIAFWAPWRTRVSWSVVVDTVAGDQVLPTASEEAAIRGEAVSFLRTVPTRWVGVLPPNLGSRDLQSVQLLWLGLAQNAAAAVCTIGLFAWKVRDRTRGRRVESMKCAECEYDLEGLVGDRCPECGQQRAIATGVNGADR